MAPSDNTFEITAGTIDFGDRVVAVPQIAFAASQKGRPFKVLGAILIVAALAALGYEAVLGAGLSALKSGGYIVYFRHTATDSVDLAGRV